MAKERSTFWGLDKSSRHLDLTYQQMVDNAIGALIVSIGKGTFRDEFLHQFQLIASWAIYNDKGL